MDVQTASRERINQIKEYENAPITATKRNVIFGGMAVGTVAVSVLFATEIIMGAAAIGVVAVGGGLMIAGFKALKAADPLIKQKYKNMVLKARYEEAAKHSILELDNEIINRTNKIKEAGNTRNIVGGQVKGLKKQLDNMVEMKGMAETHKQMSEVYTKIENAYQVLGNNIVKAQKSLEEFKNQVKIYKTKQKFADAASAIMETMNADKSITDMLVLDVAFESIDNSYYTAMTEIENLEIDKDATYE